MKEGQGTVTPSLIVKADEQGEHNPDGTEKYYPDWSFKRHEQFDKEWDDNGSEQED
jgi:hypothetical protein